MYKKKWILFKGTKVSTELMKWPEKAKNCTRRFFLEYNEEEKKLKSSKKNLLFLILFDFLYLLQKKIITCF